MISETQHQVNYYRQGSPPPTAREKLHVLQQFRSIHEQEIRLIALLSPEVHPTGKFQTSDYRQPRYTTQIYQLLFCTIYSKVTATNQPYEQDHLLLILNVCQPSMHTNHQHLPISNTCFACLYLRTSAHVHVYCALTSMHAYMHVNIHMNI